MGRDATASGNMRVICEAHARISFELPAARAPSNELDNLCDTRAIRFLSLSSEYSTVLAVLPSNLQLHSFKTLLSARLRAAKTLWSPATVSP